MGFIILVVYLLGIIIGLYIFYLIVKAAMRNGIIEADNLKAK